MQKVLLPSRWGLKMIDAIVVFIVVAAIITHVAPDTGLAQAIHTGCAWLATGVMWLATMLSRLLIWI